MIKKVALAASIFAMAAAPALAVTVSNTDSKERQVTFDKGAQEVVHKIAPGASVSEPCPEGCGVRVADGSGSDYLAQDKETLIIKDARVSPKK